MANALRASGKENFLGGDSDWDANNVKHFLYDVGADAFNAADANLSDIVGGARIATSGNYASKTKTGGVADAADITHTSVSGASVERIEIYKDTGTESTSTLWATLDSGTGLPVTPNGGDITVQWNASGIWSF